MTAVLEDSASLTAAVRRRRQQLDRQAGQAEQVAAQISAAESELAGYRAVAELNARAAALLTTIGEETQEVARAKVEELATRALQVIFGERYSFRLEPGESGGQATLKLLIRSVYPDGTVVETGVLDARGGGMAAVVGFVLRLVVLLLTPALANVLFLDEAFGFVSVRFEGRVAEFLAEVAHKAGVQVVLVTHSPAYADYADQSVRLELSEAEVTVVHRGESE